MSHSNAIAASKFSDISVHIPATPLSAAQINALDSGLEFQNLFQFDLDTPGVVKGLYTFKRIKNIRELPAMGNTSNITKVPVYGSKTSRQVNGQADAPDLTVKLNYVASEWATGTDLDELIQSGQQVVIRFTLMDNEPAGYSNTQIGAVPNSQWYWIGRLESNQVTPSLTDATQSDLKFSTQSDIFGAYTTTTGNKAPVLQTGYTGNYSLDRPAVTHTLSANELLLNGLLYGWFDSNGDELFVVVDSASSSATADVVTTDLSGNISLKNKLLGTNKVVPGVRQISYGVTDRSSRTVNAEIVKGIGFLSTDDKAAATTAAPFTVTAGDASNVMSIAISAAVGTRAIEVSGATTASTLYKVIMQARASQVGAVAIVPAADATAAIAKFDSLFARTLPVSATNGMIIDANTNESPDGFFSYAARNLNTGTDNKLFLVASDDYLGSVAISMALATVASTALVL